MQKLFIGAALALLVSQTCPVFAQTHVAVADPAVPLTTCDTPEGRGACDVEATRTEKLFALWGNGYTPSKEFLAKVAENRRKTEEAGMQREHDEKRAAESAGSEPMQREYCRTNGLEENCLGAKLEAVSDD